MKLFIVTIVASDGVTNRDVKVLASDVAEVLSKVDPHLAEGEKVIGAVVDTSDTGIIL